MAVDIPLLVRDALWRFQGSIWQHTTGTPPKLLCMATRLATGYVVTVTDQGVDGFESKPPSWDVERSEAWRRPPDRFADLRLHSLYPGHPDDQMTWLYSVFLCPLIPLVFLSTTEFPIHDTGGIVPNTWADEYAKLWRIGYGRGLMANTRHMMNGDFSHGLQISQGALIYDVNLTYFRNGADNLGDKHTLAAHAVFDYPGPIDYGAPVVTGDGLLAGVMIGGDLGPGASHQGAYIPIDLIAPFLLREARRRRRMIDHTVVHHAYPEDESDRPDRR